MTPHRTAAPQDRDHPFAGAAVLSPRDLLALDAAKLYYAAGLSQQEVSDRLHMSRPHVSKLLATARAKGFVRTSVLDPRESDSALVEALSERFDLAEVRLVVPVGRGPMDRRHALAVGAAEMLASLVVPGDVVGCWWSATIQALAELPTLATIPARALVQLNGTGPGTEVPAPLAAAARRPHSWFLAYPHPIVHGSLSAANTADSDPARRTLTMLRSSPDVMVFSAQAPGEAEILDSPAVSDAERDSVRERSVGHVCGRFIDVEGRVVAPSLNQRTLGPSLSDLRRTRRTVLVASGHEKLPIIRAALTSSYANRLVTDIETAVALAPSLR